ncbi:hypothetical protein BDV33DRAFT_106324 [Aspergillus novoparasiticus]|uniref:Uncharacterized protein n=1 Tax=Aspergillus novoparasiticus TaxID=986946 RepID=A0A5N6EPZ1_9EURO|nr:hypothetical protein BDV33DRAFT_106324 [Aspergillus novoparasiticus]
MDYVYLHGLGVSKKCGVSGKLQFLNARVVCFFYSLFFIFISSLFFASIDIFTSFYIYMGEPEVIAHDLLSDFTAHASIRPNKPVSVLVSLSGMLMSTGFLSPLLCLALCSV